MLSLHRAIRPYQSRGASINFQKFDFFCPALVRETEFQKTDSSSVFTVPDLTILSGHSLLHWQRCIEKSYSKLSGPCCVHFQKSENSNRPTKNRRPVRTRAPSGTGDSSFCFHKNFLHSTCRQRGPIFTRARVIRIPTLGGPFCILLFYVKPSCSSICVCNSLKARLVMC